MTVIEAHLTAIQKLMQGWPRLPNGYTYAGMEDFLMRHGRHWQVGAQHHVSRVPIWPKGCFDNAFRCARRWPKSYRYVEGLALNIIPIHHAWCVNANDEVVDPTWHRYSTVGVEYFGVAIPLDVAKSIRHRDNTSILANWEKRYPLFREPWSGGHDESGTDRDLLALSS